MVSVGQEKTTTAPTPEADPGLTAIASPPEAVERGVRERPGETAASGSQTPDGSPIAPMTPELALKLRAFRNARYHEDREGFYSALGRWTNFIGIILGSAAFAGGAAQLPVLAMIGGSLAAIISASRLVFDFSGKAKSHLDLRKQFLDILAAAQMKGVNVEQLEESMIKLYKNESEVYNAVNALAYNDSQSAFGRTHNLIEVGPYQAFFRHVYRFKPSDFK